MTEAVRQKLTGAVIGLARTCENNEKTKNTNRIFLEALAMAGDWSADLSDMSVTGMCDLYGTMWEYG